MSNLEASIAQHQKLVDLIAENTDQNGVCCLSDTDLAHLIGKSSSAWVGQAIKKINAEDICIYWKEGGRALKFRDLSKEGTFAKIISLYLLLAADQRLMNQNEIELAARCGVQRRTLQAAKTYLRNDWRDRTIAFLTEGQD